VKNLLLKISDVTMKFGGLIAVNDVCIDIYDQDLVAIIGPNGAGKTTLFNTITGIYTPTKGQVKFCDYQISNYPPHKICDLGIARTFQNIRLFKNLTVLDNLRLGHNTRVKYHLIHALFKTKKYLEEEKKIFEESMELLKLFHLDEKSKFLASNLPYGEQRKLEMARALASKPKLLLLDEPAAGMNPSETKELSDIIKFIRNHFKIAVVLIEHDMNLVMEIAEKIFVLDYGNLIASGSPKEIQSNKRVIEAYLGTEVETL